MNTVINRLDNLLTKNGGTGSGWWNPDHAARMSLDSPNGQRMVDVFDPEGKNMAMGRDAAVATLNFISLAKSAGLNNKYKEISGTHIQLSNIHDDISKENPYLSTTLTKRENQGNLKGEHKKSLEKVLDSIHSAEVGAASAAYMKLEEKNVDEARKYISHSNKELKRATAQIRANHNLLKEISSVDIDGKETPIERILDKIVMDFKDYNLTLRDMADY